MKKILTVLSILLISNCSSFAACTYNCVAPHDMNNKFMTALSVASGLNFVSEKIAQSIIKKEFSKIAKGDKIKYNLESYSSRDLKNGIFKSLSISGENLEINGIYLSELNIKTLCDFNYVKQENNNIVFVEDLPLSLSLKVSDSDINKTMQSNKYKKVIEDINRLGLGGIKISSTNVEIKSNKFYYHIGISIPFIKVEKKITISADLKVNNGEIDFTNTHLSSGGVKLDLSKIDYIINYINPLDFSVKILDNKNAKVSIKNASISENIVSVDAVAVIPKN